MKTNAISPKNYGVNLQIISKLKSKLYFIKNNLKRGKCYLQKINLILPAKNKFGYRAQKNKINPILINH